MPPDVVFLLWMFAGGFLCVVGVPVCGALSVWWTGVRRGREVAHAALENFNKQVAELTVEELSECIIDGKVTPGAVAYFHQCKQVAMTPHKPWQPHTPWQPKKKQEMAPMIPTEEFAKVLAQAKKALEVVGTGRLREGPIVREGCRSYVGEMVCPNPHLRIPPAPLPTNTPGPGKKCLR